MQLAGIFALALRYELGEEVGLIQCESSFFMVQKKLNSVCQLQYFNLQEDKSLCTISPKVRRESEPSVFGQSIYKKLLRSAPKSLPHHLPLFNLKGPPIPHCLLPLQ